MRQRPTALDRFLPVIVWLIAALCASAAASSLLLAGASPAHAVSLLP